MARKINTLKKKYDARFSAVFDAIRQLMEAPDPTKKQIGFHWDEKPAATKKTPMKKKASAKKKKPAKPAKT